MTINDIGLLILKLTLDIAHTKFELLTRISHITIHWLKYWVIANDFYLNILRLDMFIKILYMLIYIYSKGG
jgi:hypothetical protein